MSRKILIICYSQHYKEPRLLMQCRALKDKYQITTAGLSSVNDASVDFIQLTGRFKKALFSFHINLPKLFRLPFTLINKFHAYVLHNSEHFSGEDYRRLKKEKFDLIICHHPGSLPLAVQLKKHYGSQLVFNAHEIYSLEFEDNEKWMDKNFELIDRCLKKYLPECANVFVVNQEIGDFYKREYGCSITVAHNSKPYDEISPTAVDQPIRIIHHGGAMQQRKLEQMADAVLACHGKFVLTFMLVDTDNVYLQKLKSNYEPKGIKFIDAVPYDKIVENINQYDIGLYILPNETINHKLALPNKLFEFLQAKLALMTSPNQAMKNFILNNHIGMVSEDFSVESMTALLNSLTPELITQLKKQSSSAAKELSSDVDEQRIKATIDSLL